MKTEAAVKEERKLACSPQWVKLKVKMKTDAVVKVERCAAFGPVSYWPQVSA